MKASKISTTTDFPNSEVPPIPCTEGLTEVLPYKVSASWLSHRTLGQKLIFCYSLAFIVTLAGVATGLTISNRIEKKAYGVQAEGIEDVQNISYFKGNLFELTFRQRLLSDLIGSSEADTTEVSEEFAHFAESFEEFQQGWQEFLESDEIAGAGEVNTDDLNEDAGVTEAEAAIAAAILQDYGSTTEDYIQQVDMLLERFDPASIELGQFPLLKAELQELNQTDFITELDGFFEAVTDLARATEEEQAEGTSLLRRASAMQVRSILASVLLSGIAGLLLVTLLSRRFLRPLREVTQTAHQSIQEVNFDLNVSVVSHDEAGILAQTFNSYMLFVKQLLAKSKATNLELQSALKELHSTQGKMIQSEKMSGLGQLVAGVAHEINNPVGFIHGNVEHVQGYAQDLLRLIQLYRHHYPSPAPEIQVEAEVIDLEFIQDDLPKTLSSMKVGSNRICEIVLALRNFSRLDEAEFKLADIHTGLDNTLMILGHRLKANSKRPEIQVVKDYLPLPPIECCAGFLNQVFMNILSNAIDALEEQSEERTYQEEIDHPSQITLRTSLVDDQWVQIVIADNGSGIPEKIQQSIFDPFFTTKPVGKGTGMGMSISYQIVTERHGGKLECFSIQGKGTEFVIQIPLRRGNDVSKPETMPELTEMVS